MHGLVNRAIQCFLRDTYGDALWSGVAAAAGAPPEGFEAMLRYPASTTEALLVAAAQRLDRPRETILEDIGTYLVSHPNTAALRRLLRFGGVSFADFLDSLEDLPGRGRLAVPDLDLPSLDLEGSEAGLRLTCAGPLDGIGHVMLGLLRALADDYGALVLLDHAESDGGEVITIQLLDQRHSEGRRFHLSAGAD
ncbi:MAG: heme NO-binding domain-containing protein [Gemmobacter sp.]